MSSAQYISNILEKYSIDIIGITEHWLFPNSMDFIRTLHKDYEGVGVCSAKADPLASHHRGQGGVAFLF